jgi:hypothetical protein
MIMSAVVAKTYGYLVGLALALLVTSCGDDKPAECTKPAECVGKPLANTCKEVAGHGRCVISCIVVDGQDNCPSLYKCTGTADDGSQYCKPS